MDFCSILSKPTLNHVSFADLQPYLLVAMYEVFRAIYHGNSEDSNLFARSDFSVYDKLGRPEELDRIE